ncbi:MAG: glycosyltransferase family 9 protein [bacterium]
MKKNFLIFGLNHIGDVLMLTPAIRALKLKFPESNIFVLVSETAAPILYRNPDVYKVIERKKYKGVLNIFYLYKLYKELKKYNFYACINFLTSFEFALLSFFISKKRIGISSFKTFLFYNYKIANDKKINNIHNIDRALKLVDIFSIKEKYNSRKLIYIPAEEDIKTAINLLKASNITVNIINNNHNADDNNAVNNNNANNIAINNIPANNNNSANNAVNNNEANIAINNNAANNNSANNDKYIFDKTNIVVFSPGSTRSSKEANPELFALFADYLNKLGFYVIIIGSKKDIPLANKIYRLTSDKKLTVNLTGITDIYMLGGLIKISRLVISVDNGVMHLASAINTPLIALFGSTDPAVCGPVNDNSYIIDKKTDCYHCFLNTCDKESFVKNDYPDCMGNIELYDLTDAMKELKI